ncbi:unnamed protein product [Zymoseptoria tritici ST99CH_3D7]|uniref:Uncharacterized protein n=1 Tax=Zymoseptoria tritici (strain ST99CH_3D7) TaxID=1276538 RepID=A0A1X7RP51_ZYMT9|nr:unnamed protein product [Zymoseptoria tritici ST99CH_3D7]
MQTELQPHVERGERYCDAARLIPYRNATCPIFETEYPPARTRSSAIAARTHSSVFAVTRLIRYAIPFVYQQISRYDSQ